MYSSVPGTSNVGLKKSMIYLSYEKMHFSYIKSKILCRWLNILRYHVHSRTFFTPKIHPPLTTRPPPPPLARHQTLPATRPGPPPHTTSPGPPPHPASHSTLPATPPCQPPHPACPLSLGHDSVAIVVTRWCSPCCSAKAVCVGQRSSNNLRTLSNKLCALSNFLHTLSNILCTLSNILRTLSNNLCTLSNILCTLSNILCTIT